MIFFSIFALLFLIITLILFIPVLVTYFKTGLVLKFPTLIVSGVFAMMSMFMFVCGIILEVIVKKHRQLYELLLNNCYKK